MTTICLECHEEFSDEVLDNHGLCPDCHRFVTKSHARDARAIDALFAASDTPLAHESEVGDNRQFKRLNHRDQFSILIAVEVYQVLPVKQRYKYMCHLWRSRMTDSEHSDPPYYLEVLWNKLKAIDGRMCELAIEADWNDGIPF